jgi:hypothetical protein
MMNLSAINNQILTLLIVRKKLQDGDYLTLREEADVSTILGIPKFKDTREIAVKIDDFP